MQQWDPSLKAILRPKIVNRNQAKVVLKLTEYHWWELPQVSFSARQEYFCHDKYVFVATKNIFCHDKSMRVTKVLS